MALAKQYSAPWIYNALTVNGSAGAALTLRQMILALATPTGVVPPRTIAGFLINPSASIRLIGGYDIAAKTFVTAHSGGGYLVLPATTGGIALDVANPLDNIAWLMDGAGAGTMDVVLFLED